MVAFSHLFHVPSGLFFLVSLLCVLIYVRAPCCRIVFLTPSSYIARIYGRSKSFKLIALIYFLLLLLVGFVDLKLD